MKCARCALRASTSVARAAGDTRVPDAIGEFILIRGGAEVRLPLCGPHAKGLNATPAPAA
jgi:hypothetical protein